jgi:cytidylate kinase
MLKQILIVEREYGCGAAEIAEKAAQRLGWRLLDRELTDEIARLARADPDECARHEEQVDSWLYRLGKVFWRGSYEQTLSLEGPQVLDADRMVALVEQIIVQAAAAGKCVIVGRGAPYFLRDRLDTFTVFLYASRRIKLARVQRQIGDRAKAEDLVESVDQNRAAFIKHYFGRDWPNRHLYHLMLNTGIGIDAAVDLILHSMEVSGKNESSPLALD